MPPKPKFQLTSSEVKYSLHKLFPSPEWLGAEEVHIKGFDRYIDFWAMKVHIGKPGARYKAGFEFLSIHAVEVKVARGDFLQELKTPEKRIGERSFLHGRN